MYRISFILMLIFLNCNSQNAENILILDDKLIFELENMISEDQKYRVMMASDSLIFNTGVKDSLWTLQKKIDEKNTKRLIEIIADNGFIHSSKTNCKLPAYLIFMHSPFKYKTQILNIINYAKKNNTIDSAAYGLIKWHINGRKEIIFNPDY